MQVKCKSENITGIQTISSIPGLADTYNIALAALDSVLDLDHWKISPSILQDQNAVVVDLDKDDLGSDKEIEMSIAGMQQQGAHIHESHQIPGQGV